MRIEDIIENANILTLDTPELIDNYAEEKINNDELFRMVYIYNIGTLKGIELHVYMMTVKEHNGLTRAYNMDSDCAWLMNGKDEDIFIALSENMLYSMEKFAIEQLETDYLKQIQK